MFYAGKFKLHAYVMIDGTAKELQLYSKIETICTLKFLILLSAEIMPFNLHPYLLKVIKGDITKK